MSIEVWVKSIYEWIYPILPRTTPPAPKVPLEVFKEKLLLLSALSITNENCAKGCVESVMEVLQPAHFDLSEVGQNEILSYVEQFKTAAASTAYLYEEEQLPAILAFKKALGEAIKDKWVKGMAESFYPIPKISDESEQARTAQRWTHNFLMGAQFLDPNDLFENRSLVSKHHLHELVKKAIGAFNVLAHGKIGDRTATMLRLLNENPTKFSARAQEVEVRVEDEPGTMIIDKEMEQFFGDVASGVTMYWPEIEEGKAYLSKCVWSGFSFHWCKFSIADHPTALQIFKDVFNKPKGNYHDI